MTITITLTEEQAEQLKRWQAITIQPPQTKPAMKYGQRAEKGGEYWTWCYYKMQALLTTDDFASVDNYRHLQGGAEYQLTKEACEWAYKCLQYRQALKNAAIDAWDDAGEVIDWEDYNQYKHFVEGFNKKHNCLIINNRAYTKISHNLYFPTRYSCEKTYNNILGDDLKQYVMEAL